jgi:hypothetical protein
MPILAQTNPIFQPAMRIINNINTGQVTTVVTTFPNQYTVGLIVRLNIPEGYSLQEIDQKTGTIIEIIDPTTFVIDLDSYGLGTFTVPTEFPYDLQEAQVTPVGEINEQLTNATRNILP